ncbi:MAG: alpha/beta hydrolase [Bacteroidota bacterium]
MKTPLLLLHGALGSAAQFRDFENLLAKEFNILKLDFCGHGKNDAHPGELSIDLFTGDVLKFLDIKKTGPVSIFGYSMGGFVALDLALLYPEKVKKIFTLATKFAWSPETAQAETKLLDPEKIKEKVPAFAAHLQKLHGEKWEQLMKQTAGMMLQLGNTNPLALSELSKIKTSTTLSLGDKDKMVTLEETQAAHQALSNSALLLFPDTPHPWEQVNPNLVAKELIQFLG